MSLAEACHIIAAHQRGTAVADVCHSAPDKATVTDEDAWNDYADLIGNDAQDNVETHDSLVTWHDAMSLASRRYLANEISGEQCKRLQDDASHKLLIATAKRAVQVKTFRILTGYEAE